MTNHPASPEGTGPEVDKLNPQHVEEYMTTYLDKYKDAVGPLMGKRGLQYVVNDSWEAQTQTGPKTCWPSSRNGEAMTRCHGSCANGARGGKRTSERRFSMGLPQDAERDAGRVSLRPY